jgi:hypothetical protein
LYGTAVDLINKKFGRLTAIIPIGKSKRNGVLWLCRCDCGNYITADAGYLNSNQVRSCGCLHTEVASELRRCHSCTPLSLEHIELIDGLMLGDGFIGISKGCITPRLILTNTTQNWISLIQKALPFRWGLYERAGCVLARSKNDARTTNAKTSYHLTSFADRAFIPIYKRWYPDGKKIVPPDIVLTPLSTKHWFFGDGSTYRDKIRNSINLKLSTNGFTKQEVELLQYRLYQDANVRINIHRHTKNVDNRGYILRTSKKSEYINFFDFIGACDISEFQYKFKVHKNV